MATCSAGSEEFEADQRGVVVDKYAYLASIKEIQENDYNLNIPRYVDTFEEEEPVDVAETQQKITNLKQELTQVESKMEAYLKELGF